MVTSRLLRLLSGHNVRYIVIGAAALPAHGYVRATQDIDIFIRPSRANVRRAFAALQEFGYDLSDSSVTEMMQKKILLRQYAVATDVHPFVKGFSFDEIWRHRIVSNIEGVPTFVVGLDDLLRMKEAANRPKDREDIRVLKELRRRRDSGK